MAEPRVLTFKTVAEIMPDVDRLLEGHNTLKNWTLGQMCNHLATTFQLSIEGFPMRVPWLIRKTIGPVAKRKVFSTGTMDYGIQLPEKYCPRPGLDARAEAEALRAAVRLYSLHAGPVADHPMFGPLTRDEWSRLHCIHAAHHLCLVVPTAADRADQSP